MLDESLDLTLLLVLETMTPAERVAFVLHDVFGHRFAEIAEIAGRTPQACRQLAATGRRKARRGGRRRVDAAEHARVVTAFKEAWRTGDLDDLVRHLDPRATVVTDGGGLVSAPPAPTVPVR